MPEIDDADGSQPHLKGDKKMPKGPKQKVKEACNHTSKGDECPVHGTKDCATVKEEAPKGKKYARMVKHIKKNYPKDKEGIAYATAWKHKNSTSMEEGKSCPEGTKWCPECKKCQKVTCADAKMKAESAWQRKEGKKKSGGLNEKGRKSYERENPGSDLKAPSKKKGNKRRASFCARMKGMKNKLTSKKTANDPDSRINKSLRAWNC